MSKVTSHDVILDILSGDSNGDLFDLEIQKTDTVGHAQRTRFYGAMVDSGYLMKGKTYDDLPDVYIIYISETDLWGAGRTSYPDSTIAELLEISMSIVKGWINSEMVAVK